MKPMVRGTVVRWRDDRSFGFVRPHPGQMPVELGGDGADVFVWWGAIVTEANFKRLNIGDEVEMEVEAAPKGPRAVYATVLTPARPVMFRNNHEKKGGADV